MVASVTPSLQKPCFWPWRSRAIYEESTCSIQPQNQSWSACWGHHFWMISSRLRFWLFRSVLVAAFLNQTKYQNSVSAAQPDFGPCVGKMATVLVLIWVGTVYFDLSCSDLGAETKTKKKIKPFFFLESFFSFFHFFSKKGKEEKKQQIPQRIVEKVCIAKHLSAHNTQTSITNCVFRFFHIGLLFGEEKKKTIFLFDQIFFECSRVSSKRFAFWRQGKKLFCFFLWNLQTKRETWAASFFRNERTKKRILLVFFLLFREKQFSNWYENCSHGVRAKKGKTWNNHKITPKRESNLWRKKKKDKRIRGEKKKKRNLFFFLMVFFP